MSTPARTNLMGLDRQAIETWMADHDYKPFHGRQILKWIHHHGLTDFMAMTDLGKKLRAELLATAEIRPPEVLLSQQSQDGTHKWLLGLDCGNRIETVLIPDGDRNTLCVSSQVGCALDCRFCATAQQGFNRNLTVAEIVGQLWIAVHSLKECSITNVVLMGMGEPLANFENVLHALHLMQDDLAYGLSKYRVTLSTAGLVPALQRLGELTDVSLAVSLHAPTDALRSELVPINQKYPLAELLAACNAFIAEEKRRKVTFEYVMLDGVNDSDEQAKQLVRLLQGIPAKLNLIPFNPFPGSEYRCSSPERIERFRQILLKSGLMAITRKTRGSDIDAACGQLVGKVKDRSRRSLRLQSIQMAVGD